MVMLVSEEQPSKALSPIDVTESGMVMLVSEEQPRKAWPPIDVTESGMVMSVASSLFIYKSQPGYNGVAE